VCHVDDIRDGTYFPEEKRPRSEPPRPTESTGRITANVKIVKGTNIITTQNEKAINTRRSTTIQERLNSY
jgi:hypothetical protein